MIRIALRLIFGARGRYATMVLSPAFAVLLSTQQVAILLGVLRRATGPLQNRMSVSPTSGWCRAIRGR